MNRTVLALALLACGADEAPPEAVESPAIQRELELRGDLSVVGPGPGCGVVFCDDEAAPGAWPDVYVRADAGPGGEGTEARPWRALEEALGDGPRVIHLAPGRYAWPDRPLADAAIVGAGASVTTLDGLDVDAVEVFRASHLTVEGALVATGVGHLLLRDVLVAAVGERGVTLTGVNTAQLDRIGVRGAATAQLVAVDTALAMTASFVGPGPGAGVLAGPSAVREDCAGSPSPVCPYGAWVQIEGSLVEAVRTRGIETSRSVLLVRGSRVAGVGGEGFGVRMEQSFVALTEGTTVVDSALVGVASVSSRGLLRDVVIEGSGAGGLLVERLAPEAIRAFPRVGPRGSTSYPGCDMRPPAEWSRAPRAFAGVPDRPDGSLYPGGTNLDASGPLPGALDPDADPEGNSPELGLFRWARLRVDDIEAVDNAAFGIRVGGHAVHVRGGRIAGTIGGSGLHVEDGAPIPLSVAGASVAVLSTFEGVEVAGGVGPGVTVGRVALYTREGERTEPFLARSLRLEGLDVRANDGPGVVLIDSVAALARSGVAGNRGVGVWLSGAYARVEGNEIRGTSLGRVPGRDGAEVEVGDGVVVAGTETWADFSTEYLSVADNVIADSARAGLLVMSDLFEVGGRLALGAGRIEGSGVVDAVAVGDLRALAVEGVVFEDVELALPAAP